MSFCAYGLYIIPFIYVCSSDSAQHVFENLKLFMLLAFFPQILKLTYSVLITAYVFTTQVFSHEYFQPILHSLTDSVKFPLQDKEGPETSASSNPDCLSKS